MAPLHQQGCGTGPRPWPLLGGLAWFQEQRLHPPQCVEWCSFQTPAPQAGQLRPTCPFAPSSGARDPVTVWGQNPVARALSTQFSVFYKRGRVSGRGHLS